MVDFDAIDVDARENTLKSRKSLMKSSAEDFVLDLLQEPLEKEDLKDSIVHVRTVSSSCISEKRNDI